MPDGSRLKIREWILDILQGETAAGDRVFSSRSDQPWGEDLPAINVAIRSEPAENRSHGPRVYELATRIEVELYVRREGTTPVDKQLDQLEHEVWHAIEVHWEQLCRTFEVDQDKSGYRGMSADFAKEGGKPSAGAQLTWELTRLVEAPHDEAELAPLERVGVEYDLQGAGTTREIDARDEIEIEQE